MHNLGNNGHNHQHVKRDGLTARQRELVLRGFVMPCKNVSRGVTRMIAGGSGGGGITPKYKDQLPNNEVKWDHSIGIGVIQV